MLPPVGLQWWVYLLIALAVLAALLAVLFAIWKMKNKTPPAPNFDPELVQESFMSAQSNVDIQEVQLMLQ